MNLKDTYNKIAKDWHKDHQADTWSVEAADNFASFVKVGGSILDVGCAGGLKSKHLLNKGFRVTGIDFAENLIEIAKKEAPLGKFLVMDLKDIDTLPENYDGIFMQAVLLHIPKKEVPGILKKAVNKLNAGGVLYIAVKEKREGGVDEEVKKDNDYGYEYERFFSYFTFNEFEAWFEDLGLTIIYKDIKLPNHTARQSNWMQVIGRKK